MSLFIPEVAFKAVADAILLYIRTDYANATNKDQSYLAQLVKGVRIGSKFDMFDQAVEIFIDRGRNHPKELQVHHFYNTERASIPTIHLILPDDNEGPNGLGVDDGFQNQIYDAVSQTTKDVYNRSFDSTLHIVITSENPLEVITIYHILRAAIISTFLDVQLAGFQNPKISGGDIQIHAELVPTNIFFRAIHIGFFYDVPSPSIFTNQTFADFIAQGIALSTQIDESSSLI